MRDLLSLLIIVTVLSAPTTTSALIQSLRNGCGACLTIFEAIIHWCSLEVHAPCDFHADPNLSILLRTNFDENPYSARDLRNLGAGGRWFKSNRPD